jgi:hypothetical protein
MSTWLFHVSDDDDIPGAETSFIVVSEDHYNTHGALKSDHILDEIIQDTRIPDIEARISEESESFFTTQMTSAELREYLVGTGHFREAKLF